MASKRHPHAPRLVQWLRLLVLAALVVHFGQCWAPTSSLLRVQPRRRRDGSSSSRTSCSSVETISKFNRVVLSAETEDVEETRRVQAEIRESFKTSADSLASSPDLEVPEGFVLHPGGGRRRPTSSPTRTCCASSSACAPTPRSTSSCGSAWGTAGRTARGSGMRASASRSGRSGSRRPRTSLVSRASTAKRSTGRASRRTRPWCAQCP